MMIAEGMWDCMAVTSQREREGGETTTYLRTHDEFESELSFESSEI
jgi:hypothetical protein